jgi:hypothetical protein
MVSEALSDRERVKEMFLYTEALKIECMKSLDAKFKSGFPFDFALESMMQYTYMSDKFFLKYQIEEDDLFQAVKDLGIQKDPEIIKIMKENIEKLPPDVMMLLAG